MWYVFHNDDHYECGGVGLVCFPSQAEAIAFIEQRMKKADVPDIRGYDLIEGRNRRIEVIEVAAKVRIVPS
jgi:hypothetical protein